MWVWKGKKTWSSFYHSEREHAEMHQCFLCSITDVCMCVCTMCMLQCHTAGVPGGAVKELSGHAGANAGRERLSGDWIPA